jgi:hypothetical protein
MEPKVIEQSVARAQQMGHFRLSEQQCVTRDEGAANNWAFGFNSQGPSRVESILDRVRLEVESSDAVAALHIAHAIAGGTGSGVGCLVSDALRDAFPHKLVLHTVVWPFEHGEVITQWYNTVLSVSALRDSADAILVLSNDDVAKDLKFRTAGGAPAVSTATGSCQSALASFATLNEVMSDTMGSLYLPRSVCRVPIYRQLSFKRSDDGDAVPPTVILKNAPFDSIVESVALDPSTKLFEGTCLPRSAKGLPSAARASWASVAREAVRYAEQSFPRSSLFVARGRTSIVEGANNIRHVLETRWRSSQSDGSDSTARWNAASAINLNAIHASTLPFKGHDVSLAAFLTSASLGTKLQHAAGKVEEMLEVNAFCHHFERFGVGKDDIRDATIRCWETSSCYV